MDWTRIIADLKDTGMGQAEIASELSCGQSTISELATGHTTLPRWPVASALLQLHKKRMRQQARKQVAKVGA